MMQAPEPESKQTIESSNDWANKKRWKALTITHIVTIALFFLEIGTAFYGVTAINILGLGLAQGANFVVWAFILLFLVFFIQVGLGDENWGLWAALLVATWVILAVVVLSSNPNILGNPVN